MQVTAHPVRKRQFPFDAKKERVSYGTRVFTVKEESKVRSFDYLPHVPRHRHLGHPVALGDDIIVAIHFKPSKTLVGMFEALMISRRKAKPSGSWEDYLKRRLRFASRYFFKEAIEQEIKPRIHKLVPHCTGRLQRGMIATLNKCTRQITHFPHILKLNTLDNLGNPVYYANPVNNMPTDWLAHPGIHTYDKTLRIIYHSTGPKVYELYDPDAENEWYSKVIDSAQNWIRANVGLLYRALFLLFGNNMFTIAVYKHLRDNMEFK